MPTIKIVSTSGAARSIFANEGESLMEVIRSNDFDELAAYCGGNRSCATCHVFIDEAYIGGLPAISEVECELLDGSGYRQAGSRLSCQLPITAALEGLTATIAPRNDDDE